MVRVCYGPVEQHPAAQVTHAAVSIARGRGDGGTGTSETNDARRKRLSAGTGGVPPSPDVAASSESAALSVQFQNFPLAGRPLGASGCEQRTNGRVFVTNAIGAVLE